MSKDAAEMALVTTRGVDDARLPANYEAMKAAIAECARVDECATWASKAAALASYARQAKDEEGKREFMRVQARAIRRCGELLKEFPAKAHKGGGAQPHLSGQHSDRDRAAKDAGLSRDQKRDAIRVANVPPRDFEEAIESENPPTVTELAERGTRKKVPLIDILGRDPEEYNRSLLIAGAMHDLVNLIGDTSEERFLRGCVPRHYRKVSDSAQTLIAWMGELQELLLEKWAEANSEAK